MRYPNKVKAATHGPCNICGEESKLTWDHVPPKATGNDLKAKAALLFDNMHGDTKPVYRPISQNGNKYRSLCQRCNGVVLGSWYEPALIEMFKSVRSIVESPLKFPRHVSVSIRPAALVRAFVGHLMAAQVVGQPSKLDEDWRHCLLDRNAPIPEGYFFHIWTRRSADAEVLRDCAFMHNSTAVVFSLLAAYPVNFLLVHEAPFAPAPELRFDLGLEVEAEIKLQLDLSFNPPAGWPWHPGRTGVLFGGEALNNARRFRVR